MRLTYWFALATSVVALGCLKVAQHNAVFMGGYAVGERLARLHTEEVGVSWLNAHVVELASPGRLADIEEERRMKFVAWSMLPSAARGAETTPGRTPEGAFRMAAIDPSGAVTDGDTSD